MQPACGADVILPFSKVNNQRGGTFKVGILVADVSPSLIGHFKY